MLTKANEKEIEEMFKAGVHFGYSRSSRHPQIKDFLFGIRNNVEIFDLEKVSEKLNEAKEFVKNLAKEKKMILFVGTKFEAKKPVENAANEIEMPYITERWLGGTLTNFRAIRKRGEYLESLLSQKESGELESKYTKKERMLLEKDIVKLQRYFDGLKKMKNLPSALLIIDPQQEDSATEEARRTSIPTVGIVNSDCNPNLVKYPIPGNDSSLSSIQYFLNEIVKAYKEGQALATSELATSEEKDITK